MCLERRPLASGTFSCKWCGGDCVDDFDEYFPRTFALCRDQEEVVNKIKAKFVTCVLFEPRFSSQVATEQSIEEIAPIRQFGPH